jgi:hypothetical protein
MGDRLIWQIPRLEHLAAPQRSYLDESQRLRE